MNDDPLVAQADTCVKCGLCLPACPTFRLTANEAESPRGRIAQVQGILSGALSVDIESYRSIDRCLLCRGCEAVCPSEVPYATIIDQARRRQVRGYPAPRRWLERQILNWAARPAPLLAALRVVARPGLRQWARRSGLLHWLHLDRAEWLLPDTLPPDRLASAYPAVGPRRGRVILFPGCVGRPLGLGSVTAAIRVLTQLGFEVRLTSRVACCGAMHRHAGYGEGADRILARTALECADPGAAAVVTLASACCAELRCHPALTGRVVEISRFLADLDWPAGWTQVPRRLRVLVQVPCSQRHGLRDPGAAAALLARLPGVEAVQMPDHEVCCGAAGLYTLRQAEMSQRLLDLRLAWLRASPADLLVTTNIGCALQLAAGIRAAGLGMRVAHPVELLAERIPVF